MEDHSDLSIKLHRRYTSHHLKNKGINVKYSQKDHEWVFYLSFVDYIYL